MGLCMRCHKDKEVEGMDVGQESVLLCEKCEDTFWRRFQKFMIGK